MTLNRDETGYKHSYNPEFQFYTVERLFFTLIYQYVTMHYPLKEADIKKFDGECV